MPTPHHTDTPEREKAARIRNDLNARIEAIRQQKNLTPHGRAARMAQAREVALTKLNQLKGDELARLSDRAERLHRQLFGNTKVDEARIESIRDARDRAADLNKDPRRSQQR